MDRRALLAALGTNASLLAGCQTREREPTTDHLPKPSTCESPGDRHVAISDTASVPADADLSIDTSMGRTQVTADAPARLRIDVTNTGAPRGIDISDQRYCHLFNRTAGKSDPAGLWLYREQDAPTESVGKCWTKQASETRTFVSVGCPVQTIAESESVTTTYEVWDDYATDGYFPTGTYRFSQTISLWAGTGEYDGEPDEQVDWWIDLRVSDSEP